MLCMRCNPSVFGWESSAGAEGNGARRQKRMTSGEVHVPVGAVVNPTHLLARLQQVENPRSAAALFLDLGVATFDLGLGLRVYVQGLFV